MKRNLLTAANQMVNKLLCCVHIFISLTLKEQVPHQPSHRTSLSIRKPSDELETLFMCNSTLLRHPVCENLEEEDKVTELMHQNGKFNFPTFMSHQNWYLRFPIKAAWSIRIRNC